MRRILVAAVLSLLPSLAWPEIQRPPKRPALCSIKTVYVAVYSESSAKVKEAVKKETWLKVVRKPDNANAVLEVHETWGAGSSPSQGDQMTITAVLKNKDKNLWNGTQSWGDGAIYSDSKSAARALMDKLNEAAGGCK